METLNQMTREDYLRAEGAQMMLRLLCDDFCAKSDYTFSRWNGERYETAKFTPYQWLDAIRRFTAGVMNADAYLKGEEVVYCPVWGENKGKPTITRIDIITEKEYNRRHDDTTRSATAGQGVPADNPQVALRVGKPRVGGDGSVHTRPDKD